MRRTHDVRRIVGWLLVLLGTASSGCAGINLASGSFAPQFDCPSARLVQETVGYRLEGCGQIAFFRCSTVRDGRVHSIASSPAVFWTPQSAPEPGQFRATREGVDQSTASGHCVLQSQRAMSSQESDAALARLTPSPDVDDATRRADAATVRAKAAFQGGQLELLSPSGAPSAYLLISLHSKRAVQVDDKCRMLGFLDGTVLTIEAVRQRSPQEVQVVVPARELRGLDTSTTFHGSVCGLRFDLDERARRSLARFELAMQ